MMRHTNLLSYILIMLCPMSVLPFTMANAQDGISRRALEDLLEPEPIKQKVLVFSDPDAAFPELEETASPYTVEYSYVNRGKHPLSIRKVTVSCGCMDADFDKKPIPAGGKGSIRISFNPKGYSGNIYRQAFVYTSLSKVQPTVRLTLTGKVAPSNDPWRGYLHRFGTLRAKQKAVTFKVSDHQSKLVEVIACGNSGDRPLTLSVKNLPLYLKFGTSSPVIQPGEEADLIFQYDGTFLPVEASDTITIPVVLEGVGSEATPSQRTLTATIQFIK